MHVETVKFLLLPVYCTKNM